MQAGNAFYRTIEELPKILPILVLPQLMLLPGGFVPVTLEDNHMITLVNDALKGDRLIGVIQPLPNSQPDSDPDISHAALSSTLINNKLYDVGCMGRITNYSEIGDGSVLISLQGVCRFRLGNPVEMGVPYPLYAVEAFSGDLGAAGDDDEIDRDTFLSIFRNYLDINNMQADWETILAAPDETLVNALSIIAPFDAAEKQALLEADNLKLRSETLIALAERYMMGRGGRYGHSLQ